MSVNLHHSVSLSSFWFFVCRGCCGWWCGVWCVVRAPRRKAAPSWGYGQAVVLPPCCQPWLHWSRSAPLTPYSEGPPFLGLAVQDGCLAWVNGKSVFPQSHLELCEHTLQVVPVMAPKVGVVHESPRFGGGWVFRRQVSGGASQDLIERRGTWQ